MNETIPCSRSLGQNPAIDKPTLEASIPFQPSSDELQASRAITISALRGPIRFLADDLLEGRGPGTPSDAMVQLYLSTQFESLGLAAGGPQGTIASEKSWIQSVPMLGVITRSPAEFNFRGPVNAVSIRYFEEMIANCGVPEESISIDEAPIVFVGYGIQAPEYHWDDFKGQDLRGKILLMLNNDPEEDPALFGGRTRMYYGRWGYKYASAARQGAAGAIIIHTTPSAGYPWSVIQTSWTGEEFELRDDDSPRLKLKAWMTEEAVAKVVSNSGLELATLVSAAKKRDFQPVMLQSKLSVTLHSQVRKKETGNVIGLIPGSDPELNDEYLILMAHHDHLGLAESRDEKGDNIFNGAIDNASGVGTLLAITRAIQSLPKPLKRSVLVASVGAEEQGLLGSAYFAAHPTIDPAKITAVINVDGINHLGRSSDIQLIGAGKSSLDAIVNRVAHFQKRIVTPDLFPERGSYYRSDQFSLAKIGVPGVYLQAGTKVLGRPSGWGEEQIKSWIETHYHQRSDQYDSHWDLNGAVEDATLLFYVACEVGNSSNMQAWNAGDEFESVRKKNTSR